MFRKILMSCILCGFCYFESLGGQLETGTELLQGSKVSDEGSLALQDAKQDLGVFSINSLTGITDYSSDSIQKRKAIALWRVLVFLNNELGQTRAFNRLIDHVQYMSDNHHTLYQYDYAEGILDSQDVEAFYWEQLAEAKPEFRGGLIKAYETGNGVQQDTRYAAELKKMWRIGEESLGGQPETGTELLQGSKVSDEGSLALQDARPNFQIDFWVGITAYSRDPSQKKVAITLWRLLNNVLKSRTDFGRLIDHVQYMSDNHHTLYQYDYAEGILDSQDVEAFYWEQLAEAKSGFRNGLIEAYKTGNGVQQDTGYAAELEKMWRL